jgi:hypothetical protein
MAVRRWHLRTAPDKLRVVGRDIGPICKGFMQRLSAILIFVCATLLSAGDLTAASPLYWSDGGLIHRSALDGTGVESLVSVFSNGGIALDIVGNRMFWTDDQPRVPLGPTGVIRRSDLNGAMPVDVLPDIERPIGIALDLAGGKMYWTSTDNTIRRANLDGSGVEPLIRQDSIAQLSGIALDLVHGKLYFSYVNPLIDNLFPGGIGRANLDGSNVETIVSALGQPLGVAVDTAGNGVYWSDAMSAAGGGAIQAANLDGQQQRTLLAGLDTPFGVALDLAERDIYWTDVETGKIQRTSMSGVLPFFQDVVVGLTAPTAIAIIPEPPTSIMAAPALILAAAIFLIRKRISVASVRQ